MAYMKMDKEFGDPPIDFVDRVLTYEQARDLSMIWTGKELVNDRGELSN